MIKLDCIACDIDNTLTNKGGKLMPKTREAFEILHSQGVRIGIVSGRELDNRILESYKDWSLSFQFDFLIGMNGGMVKDTYNNRSYSIDLMDRSLMKEILEYTLDTVNERNIAVTLEGDNNHYAMNINEVIKEIELRKMFHFEDATNNVDLMCSKGCYKILYRSEEPEDDELIREMIERKYGDKLQCAISFPGTIEIFMKGYDKGTGVKMYLDWNNLSSDNLMAFGDSENDHAMLKLAGHSVCLKNGSDSTKELCDDVTDYVCLEDGVGHYLMDKVIGEAK